MFFIFKYTTNVIKYWSKNVTFSTFSVLFSKVTDKSSVILSVRRWLFWPKTHKWFSRTLYRCLGLLGEVATGQNYAELSSENSNYHCKAFDKLETPRTTPAYQYGPSYMLITIVYDNLGTSTGQNYAELSSEESELSCRALNRSRTPRIKLAYHQRACHLLKTSIYNNLVVLTYQKYAQLSSTGLKPSYEIMN